LEHSDGDQVVVDVAATIASVHVDCIEDCYKVLLTQPVDVIADDKL